MTKRARAAAAKRGWDTRRAKARARSLAAKRGWKTRRAKIRTQLPAPQPRKQPRTPTPTKQRPPAPPKTQRNEFFDWLITFQYHQKQTTRVVDFLVYHARDDWKDDTPSPFEFGDFELDLKDFHPAEGYARKYVGRTTSLYWMTKLEWDVDIIRRGISHATRLSVVPR